jgi:3-oxoacyl-[acyl-carrier protein] reductase
MPMDLKLKDDLFIVTGATAGLGRAVLERLVQEKARIIAVARRGEELEKLKDKHPEVELVIQGDVSRNEVVDMIMDALPGKHLSGVFVNAGGPPAMTVAETEMSDWDNGYRLLIRWKIDLVKRLLPLFVGRKYGRILFSESSSVRQPVENLVLSNSLRLAIVGFSKSLAQEYATHGITSNVIAPGYHETSAVERLYVKKSEQEGISVDEAKKRVEERIPMGFAGNPDDFATLACWLLSPLSKFVTGQVYALEGGAVKGTL